MMLMSSTYHDVVGSLGCILRYAHVYYSMNLRHLISLYVLYIACEAIYWWKVTMLNTEINIMMLGVLRTCTFLVSGYCVTSYVLCMANIL